MKEKVRLVCLNPQGMVEVPAPSGLVNPRVEDLTGKKIAIIWDGKKGGDKYCIAVEELLNKRYPTATTRRLVWGDAEAAEKAKQEAEAAKKAREAEAVARKEAEQCHRVHRSPLEKLQKPADPVFRSCHW